MNYLGQTESDTSEGLEFVYLPEQSLSLFDINEIRVRVLNSLTTEKFCEVVKITTTSAIKF